MKQPWLWFIAALAIAALAALILTCTMRHSAEYADWFAKKQSQEDAQFQSALDMLREYPTAAGKKK